LSKSCRQYLVTSPAALCEDPFNNPVEPLPVPIAAAGATLQTAEKMLGAPQYTMPLVLALEYAESRRQELERTFAEHYFGCPRRLQCALATPTA
jgi:hypothetical protein